MNLRQHENIAIIQTAFLGDAALALYLAQEIKGLHPNSTVTMICTPLAAPLAECATAVDMVIPFDKRHSQRGWKGMSQIFTQLQSMKVSCVFGLQRSVRTSVIAYRSSARTRIGFREASMSLLYNRRIPWLIHLHEVERNRLMLRLFSDCTLAEQPPPVRLTIQQDVVAIVTSMLAESTISTDNHIVALAPATVWATKRWTKNHWVEVAQSLRSAGKTVVIIGAESDAALCSEIADATGATSLAGRCSIPQTLALLQRCELLITNDSAPTHFGGLAGCRTITIFGSTIPDFGFAPRGNNDAVLGNDDLLCRPCGLHGRTSCPLGTMECMTSITPDMVMTAIDRDSTRVPR